MDRIFQGKSRNGSGLLPSSRKEPKTRNGAGAEKSRAHSPRMAIEKDATPMDTTRQGQDGGKKVIKQKACRAAVGKEQ